MEYMRDRKRLIFLGCIILAIILLIIVAVVLIVSQQSDGREDGDISGEQLPSNQIRISDLYQGEITIPYYDIPLNTYDNEKFLKASSNGRIFYEEAAVGVDVSDYQQDIDWTKVKANEIDFAMIRVGYRGFTEGDLVTDGRFIANITGALENEIEVGVYFFSQAITEEEAREEAAYVLDQVQNYDITYPIVFDWEPITNHAEDVTPRTNDCTVEEITAFTAVFCEEIKKVGYYPAYYINKTMAYGTYDLEVLQDYDLWYAEYQDVPSFYYHFDMWQYTESGEVDGISVEVDLNLSLKRYK